MTGEYDALSWSDLHYDLPDGLVAQTPADPRDAARLMTYRRSDGSIEDHVFAELPELLRPGDVLVRNDTRVFPARSFFHRVTGGRIEVLFLKALTAPDAGGERWEALLRGRPRREEVLENEAVGPDWPLHCIEPLGEGRWVVQSLSDAPVAELLETAGVTPLPPYITTPLDDSDRYQTTYARHPGSAAAPTAGLHFTPGLDRALADAGVAVEDVTLHVGLATFRPLRADDLSSDTLHPETYEVEAATWARLRRAHRDGRRIIAVGTTSLRVLEHLAGEDTRRPSTGSNGDDPLRGETRLFIRPGCAFRMVEGLVTNFHLPHTSLLALVMAFCGGQQTRAVYRHAVARRYRFYSFGDAMLAL